MIFDLTECQIRRLLIIGGSAASAGGGAWWWKGMTWGLASAAGGGLLAWLLTDPCQDAAAVRLPTSPPVQQKRGAFSTATQPAPAAAPAAQPAAPLFSLSFAKEPAAALPAAVKPRIVIGPICPAGQVWNQAKGTCTAPLVR